MVFETGLGVWKLVSKLESRSRRWIGLKTWKKIEHPASTTSIDTSIDNDKRMVNLEEGGKK